MGDREALTAFCEDRDVPCPCYGYNLRGVRELSCPECGRELAMHPMSVCLPTDLVVKVITPGQPRIRIDGFYNAIALERLSLVA